MKKIVIKGINWILAGIMGLLGFAGCEKYDTPVYGVQYVEYGVPSAHYTVKGTVVNSADEKPIAGIRLGYSPEVWDEDAFGPPPEYGAASYVYVISNDEGEFILTQRLFPLSSNKKLSVYVEDIDGEENGLFRSKMVEVDFENTVSSGASGSWYKGEYTTTVTINLVEVEIE